MRAQASSLLACDFLTVETAFLQRIYVLFFISLATRRIEYVACTPNPDDDWVAQQARNLFMRLGDEQPFRFLVHDRDTKLCHAFDEVFRTEGITVIRTPVQAPNANAQAERWVRTLRADCLDRILILGRRHLEHVLDVYRSHYNEHRPHRALHLRTPSGRAPAPLNATAQLRRRPPRPLTTASWTDTLPCETGSDRKPAIAKNYHLCLDLFDETCQNPRCTGQEAVQWQTAASVARSCLRAFGFVDRVGRQ